MMHVRGTCHELLNNMHFSAANALPQPLKLGNESRHLLHVERRTG